MRRKTGRNRHLRKLSCVQRWIRNFTEETQVSYLDDFRYFIEWLEDGGSEFSGMGPSELVRYQREHRDYAIVDLVIDYLHSVKEELTTGTLRRRDSVIKSFFKYNRAPLPDDVYKVQGEVPKTQGDLNRKELKQVLLACNPLYRAVFSCMFAGFMGWGEVDHWNRSGYMSLLDQLEKGKRVIVAEQDGRKQYAGIPFYNLIGGDALRLLEEYLVNHRKQGDDYIFKTKQNTPITYDVTRQYWIRRLDRLGFIDLSKGEGNSGIRYGKNLHELRDLARTEWSRSQAKPIVAEFMLGHRAQLDSNEYNKIIRDTGWSKREYRKALPWLNILSENPDQVPLDQHEAEVEELRKFREKYRPWDTVMEDPAMRRALLDLVKERRKHLQENQS